MTPPDQFETNDDAEGRRRRLWIIVAVAAAVVLAGFAIQMASGRNADNQMSELQADLNSSFNGTTSNDFAELSSIPSDDDSPDLLDALTTLGGVTPDAAQSDGEVIRARYGFSTLGGSRCVRVTWTNDDVSFETGSSTQCTAVTLD